LSVTVAVNEGQTVWCGEGAGRRAVAAVAAAAALHISNCVGSIFIVYLGQDIVDSLILIRRYRGYFTVVDYLIFISCLSVKGTRSDNLPILDVDTSLWCIPVTLIIGFSTLIVPVFTIIITAGSYSEC
jgi:hypothetical protein